MKPVLQKVAAGMFEDKLKPYYENEIKPYSTTLSASGIAAGAGLGGTLGYLANKYLFDGDSPTSAVLSTLAGSLAGASLYTANEIWSEKKRKEANKKLPRGKRVLEDGRTIEEVEDESTPWYGNPGTRGVATAAGGLGGGVAGYKLGHKLYDKWHLRESGPLGILGNRIKNLQKGIADADAQLESLGKIGKIDASGGTRIIRGRRVNTGSAKSQIQRDFENAVKPHIRTINENTRRIDDLKNKLAASKTRKWMGRIGGPLGAILAGYGMWKLTDPGSREAIAKAIDE